MQRKYYHPCVSASQLDYEIVSQTRNVLLLTSSRLTVIDAGSLYLAYIILIVISLKLRDFQLAVYCPHTRRWPLLRMGQTRMRRQVILAVYALSETLDVLSLCSRSSVAPVVRQ